MGALDLGDFPRGRDDALSGEDGGDLLLRERVALDGGCPADGADVVDLAEKDAAWAFKGDFVALERGGDFGDEVDRIVNGDELEIDMEAGRIRDLTNGAEISCPALPESMSAILRHGGLVGYVRDRLAAGGQK